MDTISIEFTREEAVTLRFLCGGAAQNPSVTPPEQAASVETPQQRKSKRSGD